MRPTLRLQRVLVLNAPVYKNNLSVCCDVSTGNTTRILNGVANVGIYRAWSEGRFLRQLISDLCPRESLTRGHYRTRQPHLYVESRRFSDISNSDFCTRSRRTQLWLDEQFRMVQIAFRLILPHETSLTQNHPWMLVNLKGSQGSIGAYISGFCRLLHFFPLTSSESGIERCSKEREPCRPPYRILYAMLAIITGLFFSYRFLVLGDDIFKPRWLNLTILLAAFVSCAYGFGLLLEIIM